MVIEDLIPELETHVPEVTDNMYYIALRSAVTRFFRESEIWNIILDPIAISAGANTAELELPAETVIVAAKSAFIDGCQLSSCGNLTIQEYNGIDGTPEYFYRSGNTITIAPTPRKTVKINLQVSLTTTSFIDEVPSEFSEAFRQAIIFAAAAYLTRMPAKPWSNSQAASSYEMYYQNDLADAKRVAKGYLDQQVTGLKYASGSRRNTDY